MMKFGQLIIGPPGSGKTTYCKYMLEFLSLLKRPAVIINLDPANENVPFKCSVNINELITVDDVMDNIGLGPNGAMIYCLEFLEKNFDWLEKKLKLIGEGKYLLIDCPGQVELFTHNTSIRNIIARLIKINFSLVAVNLIDSHYCSDAGKFISALLISLNTMLQIELPHLNILSKMDLIEKYGSLPFNLDFFTDVLDLSYLIDRLPTSEHLSRYTKLNECLVDVVERYGLVSFMPLHVEDKESMLSILKMADKANGYMYGSGEERDLNMLLSVGSELDQENLARLQEKFVNEDS